MTGPGIPELLRQALAAHRSGRLPEAARAYRAILKAEPRHPDALHLLGLIEYAQGRLDHAIDLVRRALAANPRHAEAHNNLGAILLEAGDAQSAERHCRQAAELLPAYAEAHNNLGNALQALARHREAITAYAQALNHRPAYVEAQTNMARALEELGRSAEAIAAYRKAITQRPGYVKAHVGLGNALHGAGHASEAEAAYVEALSLDPSSGPAHAGLAQVRERQARLEEAIEEADRALGLEPDNDLAAIVAAKACRRTGRPEDGLRRLRATDSKHLSALTRGYLAFEMGNCLDRMADYEAAFDAYAAGNRFLAETPQGRAVDRQFIHRLIDRLEEAAVAGWTAGWTPPADADPSRPSPIFLVGFPRSGTTLLDQILNAHPALRTLEERSAVDQVRNGIPDYPAGLAGMDDREIPAARSVYWQYVERYTSLPPAGTRLVDKLPLNLLHAPLIWRLFPDARFILALRHPCDVCLSCFMQPFEANPSMAQFETLEGTARFYRRAMDLWRRFEEVLPISVVRTRYEDMVTDFEGETRRLLVGLGLQWDDAILDYRDKAKSRDIRTPSYHQVVQPIYTRSAGRWRHYEPRLTPVLPILQPLIEAFGYSAD